VLLAPKNSKKRKKRSPISAIRALKQQKRKNRSPMKAIGARKQLKKEKEVTNEGYWRPKTAEKGKRGHQ
jgi:hypothetical protein